MKKQLLFFFFLVNSFLYAQEAWHPLGPDDFTELSNITATEIRIAIDNNNVPYIAYRDGDNANKATVRKFNGTSWEIVGTAGFSAGEVFKQPFGDDIIQMDIAIDNNNVPYVVYSDGANAGKATVQKFNGTAWEVVGTAGFSYAGAALSLNISIATDNVPYVAFSDLGLYEIPFVWRFSGTSWEFLDLIDLGVPEGGCWWTSMALDSNNEPYLAFRSADFYGGIGRKGNMYDLVWEWLDVVAFSTSHPFDLSIALNTNNVAYVVYGNATNIRRATIKKFNGTTWELVGADGISDSESYWTDIAINTNNVPYVVYQNGYSSATPGRVTVQKFNGAAWEVVGTPGFSAHVDIPVNQPEAHTSIAIDGNNVPYVAYVNGGKAYVKYLCSSTFSTDIITACDSYTWIDGNIYTESNNTATHTLTNAAGCDSVVTLNLIIDSSPDVTISNSASTLTVDQTDAIYQWLDCDNAFAPIDGENDQIFVPQANGNYAVIVEDGACSITSECVSFEMSTSGISENFSNDLVMLYPNPTNGEVTIELKEAQHSIVEIYNSIGAKVNEHFIEDHLNTITIDGDAGIYFVKLKTDNSTNTFYVLKQ